MALVINGTDFSCSAAEKTGAHENQQNMRAGVVNLTPAERKTAAGDVFRWLSLPAIAPPLQPS